MDKKIQEFIEEYKKKSKKRFDIIELEKYIIEKLGGAKSYLAFGGYEEFYKNIVKFKSEGKVKEIKSSDYNGMNPALKLRWEIIYSEEPKWDNRQILKYSDCLDFSYYVNNPKYQSEKEWEYIENIYSFLKERDSREWASVEERSLELFYDEKFLTNKKDRDKGRYGILSRLKLDFEDLKMKKYGEMFIYWNRGIKNPKNIIILENHSTFFSYKRIAEKDLSILGFTPDILIYGEGKKIENSFSFIEEIADIENIKVLYFGDIDLEGFGIYFRLKERYPNIDINLQKDAYIHLLELCNREYVNPAGFCHSEAKGVIPLYLDFFIQEMAESLNQRNFQKLLYLYDNNLRIPQELINYEYLLKVIQ
jgi:hypothetical protein